MLVADDVEADAKMDWRSVVKYAYPRISWGANGCHL